MFTFLSYKDIFVTSEILLNYCVHVANLRIYIMWHYGHIMFQSDIANITGTLSVNPAVWILWAHYVSIQRYGYYGYIMFRLSSVDIMGTLCFNPAVWILHVHYVSILHRRLSIFFYSVRTCHIEHFTFRIVGG